MANVMKRVKEEMEGALDWFSLGCRTFSSASPRQMLVKALSVANTINEGVSRPDQTGVLVCHQLDVQTH
jgi:hypothetical protein